MTVTHISVQSVSVVLPVRLRLTENLTIEINELEKT